MKKKPTSRLLSLEPPNHNKKTPVILLSLLLFTFVILVTISSTDRVLSTEFKNLISQKYYIKSAANVDSSDQSYIFSSSETFQESDLKEAEIKLRKLFEKIDQESSTRSSQPQLRSSSSAPKKCNNIEVATELNITDIYWQVTKTSNGTFYLYNAYYDDREALMGPPVVRILGFIDVLFPKVKTYCQFWYENITKPLITEVFEYRYIWYTAWGENRKGATPYLISCLSPLPEAAKCVSIVEHKCDKANNLLEVKNKRPEKKEKFIVSVKKFNYNEDISMQIIEWLEIIKILGANKVEFSVLNVHKNVLNVLKFYESDEFVKVKLIKYPSDFPEIDNWHQRMQNELIAYHDTFYENLYSYDFLLPMDTDEFIIPLRPEDKNWADLLNRTAWKAIEQQKFADSFQVENHYFLLKTPLKNFTSITGIPKNLYFLSNIFRAANFTPHNGNAKTFLRMDRVLTIHNHFPFSCIDNSNKNWCENFKVAREDGQLSHYRHECLTDECKNSMLNPVADTTLYKYKDQIIHGMMDAVKKIKIFTSGKLDFNLG